MRSWARGSVFFLLLACGIASAQTPQQKPPAKKAAAHRANELTLAGLRPGLDILDRALRLYRRFDIPTNDAGSAKVGEQKVWGDVCRWQSLSVDFDLKRRIQVIRVTSSDGIDVICSKQSPSPWKTGRGLRVGDRAVRVSELYGEPDSRSPSTKGGQPLELMYYAFDWAGPDVPQVMEVLCNKGKNGEPGWVVEITLAAPSL